MSAEQVILAGSTFLAVGASAVAVVSLVRYLADIRGENLAKRKEYDPDETLDGEK